jgi:hypothetical protein
MIPPEHKTTDGSVVYPTPSERIVPGLFMTVRREIVKLRRETGAR